MRIGWLRLPLPAVVGFVFGPLLVVLRGRPIFEVDGGIFLSVAAAITHGDRLYAQVWDNKPPLFYYADALSFSVLGWRGPFVIDLLWIVVAALSMWRLLASAGASSSTRLVGVVVYPLLLTGSWYRAGYSELPGLALAPAVGWLWTCGRPRAAGAALGILAFLRPDYGLVFGALILAPSLILRPPWLVLRKRLLHLLEMFAVVLAASVAVLAVRGELGGYLHTIGGYIGYEDLALAQTGRATGFTGHVSAFASAFFGSRIRDAMLLVVGVTAALVLARSRARRRTPPILVLLAVATTATAAVTLALTMLWDHNLELVALPGTLVACVLASWAEGATRAGPGRVAAIGVAALLCAASFGGLPRHSPESVLPLATWGRTPSSASALALNEAAARLDRPGARVRYARLGTNNDDAHAAFTDRRLALACPVFHQYGFSPDLGEALACIRRRRPELLLVGPTFTPAAWPDSPRWARFVSAARRLLDDRYVVELSRPDDGRTVEVWRLRD